MATISTTALSTTVTGGAAGHITDSNTTHGAVNNLTTVLGGWQTTDRALRVDTPEAYGAVGNGVADDTVAVRAAFTAANARKIVDGTYADPGATVVLSKVYNLSSLATPIDMMCNVESDGASFLIPSGYTGIAVRAGHTTAGNVLRNANIEVPSVIGATVAGPGSLPAGSVGVQIRNLYTSDVKAGNVLYFETGIQVGGATHGVAYNRIMFRTISYSKVRLALKPVDSGGWSNQNTYIGGSTTGSTAWEGRRNSGSRAVVLDGVGSSAITGNTFVGVSFESDVYEHVIEFKNAYQNQFYGCRHEQGIAAVGLTVSGDTLTSTAHVLAVADMVTFAGTATAGGMSFEAPYYVVAVPTADTFKVSTARGGTAITFTSGGTAVNYSRPQRVLFDKSWDNIIDLPMGPLKWLDKTYVSAVPADTANDVIRYPGRTTADVYTASLWPVHRARNRFTSGAQIQPLWAAYPSTVDPDADPAGWTTAMSSSGLNFAASGAEVGRLNASSAGVLRWQKPSDALLYEVPSCKRTGGSFTLVSGTALAASVVTTFTMTMTGTAVKDHVVVTTQALPAGIAFSHAWVSSADTVTVGLANLTASLVTTVADILFEGLVFRRFF